MKRLVNGVWVDDKSPSAGANVQPQQAAAANTAPQTVSPTAQGGSPEVPTVSTATKTASSAVKPIYAGTYDQQLNDLYNDISNRKKFSYDINQDALYQQYAQQYINKGRLAMKDTMGQAAALTGGYGSSYGAQVGQQSYDAYLQQLNDVIPDLYAQAYEQYKDEGDNMMRQYAMLGDLKADEYNKYRDALGDYNYEQETAYNQQQDAYNRLYALIASSGYVPTDSELLAAGMTRESAENIRNEYQRGVDADQWQRDYQEQYFAWQQQSAADQMAMQQQQFDSDLAYKYAALEAGRSSGGSGGGYGGGSSGVNENMGYIELTTPNGSPYYVTGSVKTEADRKALEKKAEKANDYMYSQQNLIWYRNS